MLIGALIITMGRALVKSPRRGLHGWRGEAAPTSLSGRSPVPVLLSSQEKGRLRKMIRSGGSSAQAMTRARILLKIAEGWSAPQVAAALDISERTVFRAKRRYAEEGLDEVLRHRNQVQRHRKVDERVEAHLIALACSPSPEGHDHWTLRLLAGKAVELELVTSLSHETVRLRLKKTHSSRSRRSSGVFRR